MAAIKKIISDYFRTHCKRQLYYNICRDALPEEIAKAIQQNLDDNKIVQKLLESGRKWETEKFGELSECFNENLAGRKAVVDDRRQDDKGRGVFEKLDKYLKDRFPRHQSGTFIFEPEFALPDDFIDRMELGKHPDFVAGYICRPDILELLPDRLPDSHEAKFRRYLTPEGRVLPMDENDDRQRLRVIDIKLLSQTSPSYFAEVTLYSMILASWLQEHGLDSEYAVVPNAAIWPGSYNESELKKVYSERKNETSLNELWLAMQDDLEEAPIEAFVGAIRQFFTKTVPEVLNMTPEQCDAEACVTHRCRGCIFLEGLPQLESIESPRSFLGCKDLAERSGHLSLVPLMSEGTITLFRDEFGVAQTGNLSELPHEKILQSDCKYLKSSGRIAIERAKAIEIARTSPEPPKARLLEDTGTSCEMPKNPDVHVYLNTSYDFVHLVTLCFGMRVVDSAGRTKDFIRTVEKNDIELEAEAFLKFCGDIISVLDENANATIQFYFWDEKQYEHFQRLVERHGKQFENNSKLSRIVFLTPPEMVLPNPAMETWQSPRTIVADVLNPRLVASIPYHYSLLDTARCFHDPSKKESDFAMPELSDEIFGGSLPFEEMLNSQIPSDRIYDLWNLSVQDDDSSVESRLELLQAIDKAVEVQLDALETITRRLESDMEPSLFSMPPRAQSIQPPPPTPIATDAEIWLRFSQLDVNTAEQEIKKIQSLSPLEKEAQCESAKIVGILRDTERREALESLELPYDPGSNFPLVCRLSEDSREAKFKEDDFTCCIAPLNDPLFLSSPLSKYFRGNVPHWIKSTIDLTTVSVMAVDREKRLIVLAPKQAKYSNAMDVLRDLMKRKIIDPTGFLVEKIATEFFVEKFSRVAVAIGNPPEAVENSITRKLGKKLGHAASVGTTERPLTASTPASQAIWNAKKLSETMVERNLVSIFRFLDDNKIALNESQRRAVEQALSKRFSLLWGPPGTGKSKTLCAVALGAIHEALVNRQSLRLLITGPTNTAIDNVLDELHRRAEELFSDRKSDIRFLRFDGSPKPNTPIPECKADKLDPADAERLGKRRGITVVGSTPQQVYKLPNLQGQRDEPFRCGEFFDLVLLDEASQVEVSQAFLVYSTLAEDASVVIAGDPLQMPPIQQARVPKGLEPMLGSVYEYYAHEKTWAIRPCELLVNYRSNAVIVDLAREANYPPALKSAKPNLAIRLKESGSADPWVARLIDPSIPVSAFVHKDGKSNQSNPFEAYCVEKIVASLRENLFHELGGDTSNPSDEFHSNETFWTQGIGIVTPHRAQQALVVRRLQALFCKGKGAGTTKLKAMIRDAVDTVERFQGQQRDVILISFGMGDRDAIKKEEEFLMSLNRFNVMTSRARAKLVLFLSEELVHYVPEDVEVQKQSRFLKAFTDVFCSRNETLTISTNSNGSVGNVEGTFLFHENMILPKTIEEKPVLSTNLPKHGTVRFERGDETDFAMMFGDGFYQGCEFRITDRYIHHSRHFFSLMEFVKTVYRKKRSNRVAIRISTTRCNPSDYATGDRNPQARQSEMIQKAIQEAKSVGIDMEFVFKTDAQAFDDHAREIETNHGWKIVLDRGFDMFIFPPDGRWIGDSRVFNMEEETQILKTHKSLIVIEPPCEAV